MLKRPARIANESGGLPPDRDRLVNEENENAACQRHDRKHVTIIAAHPPGRMEKAEEKDPRDDGGAEQGERCDDRIAHAPAPVEPEQAEEGCEPRPGQSYEQVNII